MPQFSASIVCNGAALPVVEGGKGEKYVVPQKDQNYSIQLQSQLLGADEDVGREAEKPGIYHCRITVDGRIAQELIISHANGEKSITKTCTGMVSSGGAFQMEGNCPDSVPDPQEKLADDIYRLARTGVSVVGTIALEVQPVINFRPAPFPRADDGPFITDLTGHGYPAASVLVDLKDHRSVAIYGKSSPQGNFLSRFTWESLQKVTLVSPINHANVEQDPKELEKLGKIEVILRTVVSLGDPGVELDEQDAGGFDGSPAIMIYTTNVRPISEYTRFPTPERLGPGRAIDRHLGDVKTEMDASLSFRFEYCDRSQLQKRLDPADAPPAKLSSSSRESSDQLAADDSDYDGGKRGEEEDDEDGSEDDLEFKGAHYVPARRSKGKSTAAPKRTSASASTATPSRSSHSQAKAKPRPSSGAIVAARAPSIASTSRQLATPPRTASTSTSQIGSQAIKFPPPTPSVESPVTSLQDVKKAITLEKIAKTKVVAEYAVLEIEIEDRESMITDAAQGENLEELERDLDGLRWKIFLNVEFSQKVEPIKSAFLQKEKIDIEAQIEVEKQQKLGENLGEKRMDVDERAEDRASVKEGKKRAISVEAAVEAVKKVKKEVLRQEIVLSDDSD